MNQQAFRACAGLQHTHRGAFAIQTQPAHLNLRAVASLAAGLKERLNILDEIDRDGRIRNGPGQQKQ